MALRCRACFPVGVLTDVSKNLGKTAGRCIAHDIYGVNPHPDFQLRPPENFDFFNSLRLIEIDAFSGVTVALVKSVHWTDGTTSVSSIKVDGTVFYTGTFDGPLPPGFTLDSETYWIVVASRQLTSHGAAHASALTTLGCTINADFQEQFFMFMRAHELVSFDESQRLKFVEEVSYQPEASGYTATPVPDLYPFYEPLAVYEVTPNSPLAGRSVFWFSYVIAANWKALPGAHLRSAALQDIARIYDANLWHFPIDNARIAITAAHFKHTFVDLYRCLEWLFSIPRAVLVKNELGLSTKATELARTFRDKLAWRRAEQDSLRLLILDAGIHNLDANALQACMQELLPPKPAIGQALFQPGQPDTEEKWIDFVATSLAKRIYAVRNQFVHQIDEREQQRVDKQAEPALIEVLARLCIVLYTKYSVEF
jgi:hypothetical protein